MLRLSTLTINTTMLKKIFQTDRHKEFCKKLTLERSDPYISTTIEGTQKPHIHPVNISHVPMIAKQISNMKIDQHTLY